MAKIEGHGDTAPKPGFGKGEFEGVGTFSPDPGLEMQKGVPQGNCGRSSTMQVEKMEWPGAKEFMHGDDGDGDKDK